MHEMNLPENLIWNILELMDTYKVAILNQHSIKELIEFKCNFFYLIFSSLIVIDGMEKFINEFVRVCLQEPILK